MITDKYLGYEQDGVKVNLYPKGMIRFGLATVTNAAGSAVVTQCAGRFKLVIDTVGQVNTSYWTLGDNAIQTAIDSLIQRSWAM